MQITTFPAKTIPSGKAETITAEAFAQRLQHFDIRRHKDGPLYSLCQFDRDYREDCNVRAIHGLVLDVDNAHLEINKDASPSTPEEFLNELDDYYCFWHSTFSSTPAHPRFRFILPFATPISREQWPAVYRDIVDRLGQPEGLDAGSAQLSRSYYYPSAPHIDNTFSGINPGELFDASAYPASDCYVPLSSTNGTAASGRNEKLKSMATACFYGGKGLDATIAELVDYDSKHHAQPLFTDRSENCYVAGNAHVGALQFVSRIFASIAKNGHTMPAVQTVPVGTEPKPSFVISSDFALSAPGLVGQLTQYITETAVQPQPALSLAAALTTIAALKGHGIRGKTDLRTNLYCLGLAGSGTGKNHPLTACRQILRLIEQSELLAGAPKSDAGLIQALADNNGKRLILWDEVGLALQKCMSARAGNWEQRIAEAMMQLFSCAGSVFLGDQLANRDGKTPRVDIEQPHLCVYGASVKSSLFDAMTSASAVSGFLPRWLIFEIEDPTVAPQVPSTTPPSALLLDGLRALAAMSASALPGSQPTTAVYSDEALSMLTEAQDYFVSRRNDAHRRNDDTAAAIWSRGAEHTEKIALTVCQGTCVQADDVQWSFQLAKQCAEALALAVVEHVSENAHHAAVQKVKSIISKAGNGGITKSQLIRKTQHLTKDLRAKILDDMIESGSILSTIDPTGTKTVIKYFSAGTE